MSRLFTIYGATGQQGGALIKYILSHPRFSKIYRVRGVTRDINKPSARKLVDQGVEMVEADMDKPDSLKVATKGSYAVFAVTNYWDKASAVVEVAQGKAIADAAVEAGAEILIWSSLPRLGLPNFDSKADVEVYIRTLPIKALFYMPGWFMQNYLGFAKPTMKRDEDDGIYIMGKPWPTANSRTLVPLIDISDTGKFLQPFLDNPEKYNHINVTASTAFYTPSQMCETWTLVTGYDVRFEDLSDGQDRDTEVQAAALDSPYYGQGSKKSLDWALAQMEEIPNSWQTFVETHEPWFA